MVSSAMPGTISQLNSDFGVVDVTSPAALKCWAISLGRLEYVATLKIASAPHMAHGTTRSSGIYCSTRGTARSP